tara:strand:+ start:873 stop:1334 length:462 start_codon:yes stop_codon:yes gene_type:complete
MKLKHTPSEIVAQLLIDLDLSSDPEETGTGTVSDFPIFIAFFPDTPNNSLCISDTDGVLLSRDMVEGETVDRYGLQIRSRVKTTEYTSGYNKLAEMRQVFSEDVLDNQVELESTQYIIHNLRVTGTILVSGKESPQSKRNLFSLNLLATIHQL